MSSWGRRRPTTSAACHDPRTHPRIPIPVDAQPSVLRLPTVRRAGHHTPHSGGAAGSSDVPRRLSVAAAPDPPIRPSTLRRRAALSRTGSGPRSLSVRPRPRFPHRGANQQWSRRDRVPSLNSPPRRCPVRGFGPGDDALSGSRSPSTPLSPPRTPVLTDRTSRSGSVGRGWGVLPITACPTAAPR